jgi:uncharacterized protein
MNKYIFTSLNQNAGKTGIIVGLSKLIKGKIGYLKPFGDRLLYKDKRLWDYDSALITNLLDIKQNPEGLSIGFDHSKLKYLYDEKSMAIKLNEMIDDLSTETDILFIETGSNLIQGVSVHLDALTIAKTTDAKLIIVASGNNDDIIDNLTYLIHNVRLKGVDLAGIVINKVKDLDDFKMNYEDSITSLGINILGILPYEPELTFPTVRLLADGLDAKVITGKSNLNIVAREIFVGAMSGDAAQRVEKFKNKNKLIITAGDRTDMIVAAINTECVGIVLTNNILPPPNIIALASERKVPLLLVQSDTHKVAKKIGQMVPLINFSDSNKIEILEESVKNYTTLVDLV